MNGMADAMERRRECDRLVAAAHVLREMGHKQGPWAVIQVTQTAAHSVDVLLDSGESIGVHGQLSHCILEPIGFPTQNSEALPNDD